MADLIDRQAAIDALGERPMVWTSDDDYSLGERNQYDIDRLAIETVPSADVQPHQLTEEDLNELRHRFGKDVECVVRDMISGKDERWQNG